MRTSLVALALAAALAGGLPLDTIWSFFTSAWSASADEGCGFDPSGRCAPAPQTDAGCRFDPNGLCQPAPQADAGCGFDPDG
ncbi:MAG: hypothetical protein ACJ8BC_14075 [Gemmatimonadales bacterium]